MKRRVHSAFLSLIFLSALLTIGAQKITAQTFTVTATPGPHGSISPSGYNSYGAGSTPAFSINPDPGYRLTEVFADGVSQGTTDPYIFNVSSGDHTLTATFAQNIYAITADAGAHGSINRQFSTDAPGGEDFTIVNTPDPGYRVADIIVDGESTGLTTQIFTFPSVISNHTFRVVFAQNIYNITVSAGPHGAVSNPGTNQYGGGSDVSIAILPDPNYEVATYTVDGNVSTGSITLYSFSTLNADHTFSVTFKPIIYSITATAGQHGTISNAGSINVTSGSDQSYNITPASGYKVSQVTVDGISQGAINQYTFHIITANHSINALFVPAVSFTIKATSGSNGAITPAGNSSVGYGNNSTYSITPTTGYHIATLKVDGTSLTPATSYTFTNVMANHTIAATYALNSYTITASASTGGTISPTGTLAVSPGGTKTYTIKPGAGYTIADVTIDGLSIGTVKSYVFTNLSANHLIIASFTPANYIITSSAGANGSISPSGPVSLGYGASQTYTFTAIDGYNISKLTIDGKSVPIVPSYTFTNVTAAHTIAVSFVCPKPATPVLSGPASVLKGQDNLVYTVTNPTAGNSFLWTVPGITTIVSGQGTSSITVKWGKTAGNVSCVASSNCSSSAKATYLVSLGAAGSRLVNEYVDTTTETTETGVFNLKVNPNPVQDKANISFTLTETTQCKLSLTDVTGRLMTVTNIPGQKGYNQTSMDVSRFAGGVYYLTLVYGHEIKTVMLVKAK